MTPHADRRVTAEMWRASVSLSPWHDRTQVELREARAYDGTRVLPGQIIMRDLQERK